MPENSVIYVDRIVELPYLYVPYSSIEAARRKHPDSTLYVYLAIAPKGYKIVAHPIRMEKPKPGEEEEEGDVIQ